MEVHPGVLFTAGWNVKDFSESHQDSDVLFKYTLAKKGGWCDIDTFLRFFKDTYTIVNDSNLLSTIVAGTVLMFLQNIVPTKKDR